ncbi:MAG: hypothetical protein ACO201_06415 [Rickettsiales bacterium]
MSKAIVVLIGNNGTIISKHDGKNVTSEFVEKISDDNKPNLNSFFNKNKHFPIYIILDTIDQTYKKKTYPSMRQYDLDKIAKRDLSSDGDKESLKNYIILKNNKTPSKRSLIKKNDSGSKTDCLFITSSKSENINNWLNFIYELPNRLIGIYMLPVEAFNFFKKIIETTSTIKNQSILKIKEHSIFCLVIQTKTGGSRQIVFSNASIVFTRVVNYNFNESNYSEKYFQDIYSTFEYLKRLYIDLSLSQFEVINIIPETASAEIMKSKNVELNITNFSVRNSADLLKLNNLKIEDDYFDILLNSVFINSPKILKFTNQKIKYNENLYLIIVGSYLFNFILTMILFFVAFVVYNTNINITDKIQKAQDQMILAQNEFAKIKKVSMEGNFQQGDKEISIERVADFGRVEESLGPLIKYNFIDTYSKMAFSKDFDINVSSMVYNLGGFNSHNSNTKNTIIETVFSGKIINKSGDIETLFTEFDKFIVEMKKNITDSEIKYNELPRNIDFNQKYYDFPFEFRITKKIFEEKTIENENK